MALETETRKDGSLGDGVSHMIRTQVIKEPASLLILVLLLTVMDSQPPCGSKKVARSCSLDPSRFQSDEEKTTCFSLLTVYTGLLA